MLPAGVGVIPVGSCTELGLTVDPVGKGNTTHQLEFASRVRFSVASEGAGGGCDVPREESNRTVSPAGMKVPLMIHPLGREMVVPLTIEKPAAMGRAICAPPAGAVEPFPNRKFIEPLGSWRSSPLGGVTTVPRGRTVEAPTGKVMKGNPSCTDSKTKRATVGVGDTPVGNSPDPAGTVILEPAGMRRSLRLMGSLMVGRGVGL